MADKLVCWECGGTLKGISMPITRFSECVRCRADLHVCRMCKFYDPKLIGQCRHDRADRVTEKTRANFCTHFRPKRGAHLPDSAASTNTARGELDALFGITATDDEARRSSADRHRLDVERARAELDALFGSGGKTSSDGDT